MKLFGTRFGPLYVFGAVCLGLALVLRVSLALAAIHDMDAMLWALVKMLAVGLLFDLVAFFYVALPAAVFLLAAPDRLVRWRPVRWFGVGLYFVAIYVLLFSEVAEWFFWDEFGARFNFVAVDYLVYTQELTRNAWESYPVVPVLAAMFVAVLAVVLATRKVFLAGFHAPSSFGRRLAPGAVFLAVPVLAAAFVDQSWSRVSTNHYTNELAKNGIYSFFYALANNVLEYDQFYLTEDDRDAFARLRELVKEPDATFVGDGPLDITRQVAHAGPEKRWNVVIAVVESLSAKYLAAFGNEEHLTPTLDRLAAEGLFFRHFFATGTRTDRGLEAITLSLPPTPGRLMLKRPDNERLFSIGPIFRSRGYDTKFIYSGFGTFDNMNTFFHGNAFTTIDGADFAPDEVTFANAWGVCDEDLYRRVVKECDRSHAAGRPFCFVVLTTSNHRPFTHPEKPGIPSGTRPMAVKYADYAIGAFLESARSEPWFDDTLFVIVADHCASSAGKSEVPVQQYHIPLLVYAPKLVKPACVDRLASQMDLAPTLLGLLNFTYRSRFFGKDVLGSTHDRALVGNYEKVGLFAAGKLVLLLPRKKAQTFKADENGHQTECREDKKLLLDAVSYYQSAAYLLRNHLYTAE